MSLLSNRRQFLKLISGSASTLALAPLSSCLNALQGTQPFSLYWLHMEGAPPRRLFDFWPDPNHLHASSLPMVNTVRVKCHGLNYHLPEVWQGACSPLLYSWVGIRGLSTTSPHLKECRAEWFPSHKGKSFFENLQENSPKDHPLQLQFSTQHERLDKIYSRLLGSEFHYSQKPGSTLLAPWFQDHGSPLSFSKKGKIHLHVLNQADHPQKEHLPFENLTQIDQEDEKALKSFYHSLRMELEKLVESLKQKGLFNRTVILITSDRNKFIKKDGDLFRGEPLWQGLNFSLISGALKGPVTLGDIHAKHPRYSESYPGAWGAGVKDWTANDVHHLVRELVHAPLYNQNAANKKEQNPWLGIEPLQTLSFKEPVGRFF